jgi:hypothetical protein
VNWLSQYFLNPSFVLPGAALVAIPIVIHFLNRLRYKRVRFAAMQFLLKSDKRNRRRVMIEQLLLLAVRCLMVLLLAALISRLVLDSTQLSIFRGARSHHFVILDDSGSMNDRWGETNAFAEGVSVVKRLLSEGASQPGTQQVSIMLMSRPDKLLVTEETVDESLLAEVTTKLNSLKCTSRALEPRVALESAQRLLAGDRSVVRQVHMVSDFRERDWTAQPGVVDAIKALDSAGINVNIARVVPSQHGNLAVTRLLPVTSDPAVGVPVRFRIGVQNFGESVARDVALSILVDGQRLPVTVQFAKVEPGEEAIQTQDLTFDTPGQHSVEITMGPDSVESDNARFATLDIVDANPVLIIDGDPEGSAGRYVSAAIAADPKLTGYAPSTETPRFLRTQPLDSYRCIYMLNVPSLTEDGLDALQKYVAAGGGLVWFAGDLVDAGYYSNELYANGRGVFPVRLNPASLPFESVEGPDVVFSSHPIFEVFAIEELQFAAALQVFNWLPVADDWETDDTRRADGVTTTATLANGQPFAFAHRFGKGQVFTFLTAVDRDWTNWPVGDANPSFVIVNLDLQRVVAQSNVADSSRAVGDSIELRLGAARYRDTVEIDLPERAGGQTLRMTAAPEAVAEGQVASTDLLAAYRETDAAGVYRVRLTDQNQLQEERWLAFNVSPTESDLKLADDGEFLDKLDGVENLTIQAPGNTNWLQGRDVGHEMRWLLLIGLLVLFVAEQIMAYRFSYHPKSAGAAA